jgi:protein-S-isoprenylcysteine O-methyltransferase Ste14
MNIADMLKVLFKREFYLDMAVFIFLCIPIVLVILFFSIKVDRLLGFKFFIDTPYNILFFVLFSSLGWIIIWWAYTYLVIVGEGSPCPQLGGTRKLVTSGPYALIRHPSVIGKLLGVIGLGCLFKATSFTFVVIPLLFTGSAFYNRFIQEKGCVEKFKDEYLAYRKAVPMFIPKLKRPK